jgi:hypothetical protein
MENQEEPKKKPQVFDSSRSKAIQELYAKKGIECVDKTEEAIGTTSVLFWNTPKSEPTDEAETSLRNLNRRKPSEEK